jgi:hypothetical protein
MHSGYKLRVVTFGTKSRRVIKTRQLLSERQPISDDYLPSMRKAVLSISGNVYKQQEMEIDKLINDV